MRKEEARIERERKEREAIEQKQYADARAKDEKELRTKLKELDLGSGKEFWTKDGYLYGEGYITMNDEDIQDARSLDLLLNFSPSRRLEYPSGIGFIHYREKHWVIAKFTKDGTIKVLGMKEAHLVKYNGSEKIFGWIR